MITENKRATEIQKTETLDRVASEDRGADPAENSDDEARRRYAQRYPGAMVGAGARPSRVPSASADLTATPPSVRALLALSDADAVRALTRASTRLRAELGPAQQRQQQQAAGQRLAAWLWVLLARVAHSPGAGAMQPGDVAVVREAAQRAAEATQWLRTSGETRARSSAGAQRSADAGISPGGVAPGPEAQGRATVDMMLTIAAEVFGQQDLLQLRPGKYAG